SLPRPPPSPTSFPYTTLFRSSISFLRAHRGHRRGSPRGHERTVRITDRIGEDRNSRTRGQNGDSDGVAVQDAELAGVHAPRRDTPVFSAHFSRKTTLVPLEVSEFMT